MENIFLFLLLALVIGGVIYYLIKAKKRGQKCVGCPYAKQCSGNCSHS